MRVSGPAVGDIAARVVPAALPLRHRYAHHAAILDVDGIAIDDGIALYFQGPASATGEDVLELHTHGSPLITELLMRALMQAGARLAGPGEFTRRAFLAGKLDLSAAEAVADLIAAESRSSIRAAAAKLGGQVARVVAQAERELRTVLEELAAAIDFPDEVADPNREDLHQRLSATAQALGGLLGGSRHERIVRDGAQVALIGPPNAGKSSLLNALLEEDRALVSAIPGTTRDTIEEAIELDGLIIRLIDTAGIRSDADELETAGIARSQAALRTARLALIVLDGSQALSPEALAILEQTQAAERLIFYNKADLGRSGHNMQAHPAADYLCGSVRWETTLTALRSALRKKLVGEAARVDLERPTLARNREISAAQTALSSLGYALHSLASGEAIDLLSGDISAAIAALGKITGATVQEETLDGIFSRFCIGK